jgi:hypothetical protein
VSWAHTQALQHSPLQPCQWEISTENTSHPSAYFHSDSVRWIPFHHQRWWRCSPVLKGTFWKGKIWAACSCKSSATILETISNRFSPKPGRISKYVFFQRMSVLQSSIALFYIQMPIFKTTMDI